MKKNLLCLPIIIGFWFVLMIDNEPINEESTLIEPTLINTYEYGTWKWFKNQRLNIKLKETICMPPPNMIKNDEYIKYGWSKIECYLHPNLSSYHEQYSPKLFRFGKYNLCEFTNVHNVIYHNVKYPPVYLNISVICNTVKYKNIRKIILDHNYSQPQTTVNVIQTDNIKQYYIPKQESIKRVMYSISLINLDGNQ